MRLHWLRFILILAAGVSLGFLWNAASGRGIALGQSVLVQEGDEMVQAQAARKLLDEGAIFLDARPRDFWRMNRIPGALSLPDEGFEKAFPDVEPQLRLGRPIVVYCSGYGCEASHNVSRKLREKGFAAAVLDEDLPAWEDAQLPIDKEPRT